MNRYYIYRNKNNENKYIEIKKTKCSHYYVRQFMKWHTENGIVLNYTGYSNGRFTRTTRSRHLDELIKDYDLVATKRV